MERRYSSRFFRIYVPQVHEMQTDFCLYARKRLNKHKFRFRYAADASGRGSAPTLTRKVAGLSVALSLDGLSMSKWNNPAYGGKVVMTPTPQAKRFRLAVPKAAARVSFDIEQEARKQELVVRLNSQPKRFNLFRARAAADESVDVYKALVQVRNLPSVSCVDEANATLTLFLRWLWMEQKFINPVVEVRCPKTNNTVFKIEREGVRRRLRCGLSWASRRAR